MSAKKTTTAKETKSAKAKPAAKAKGTKATSGDAKKLSAVGAAAKVLGESREPMNCQELIDAMAAKGYWSSPGGKTPASTLYAAILREINTKGNDSRFKRADRGTFAINA